MTAVEYAICVRDLERACRAADAARMTVAGVRDAERFAKLAWHALDNCLKCFCLYHAEPVRPVEPLGIEGEDDMPVCVEYGEPIGFRGKSTTAEG